jgi:multidrug efflux pump subunit AcrA (membrane-fusion protein)
MATFRPASTASHRLPRAAALPLAAAIPALALLLAGCNRSASTAADQPVPVRLRQPAHVVQPVSVSVGGSVEANVTAQCAFQVAGRVSRVLVEEGQHVVKGQLLAQLDPADYRNAADAAQAQADAAQASSQKAQNGLRAQELEQSRIEFERTQDEYRRMKLLYERKSLAANDFQKYEAASPGHARRREELRLRPGPRRARPGRRGA